MTHHSLEARGAAPRNLALRAANVEAGILVLQKSGSASLYKVLEALGYVEQMECEIAQLARYRTTPAGVALARGIP